MNFNSSNMPIMRSPLTQPGLPARRSSSPATHTITTVRPLSCSRRWLRVDFTPSIQLGSSLIFAISFTFITFVAGIYAFYLLARRWMSAWAAFAATLLFAAQPVFWGHAFISPKDIPFLSAFLISLVLGLRMADSQPTINGRPPRALMWITGFWILSLLFFFFTPQFLDNGLASLIRNASSQPQSFFGALLRNLSSSFGRTKPDIYIQKHWWL